MAYDYIRRAYGIPVRPGSRVRLEGTAHHGTVMPCPASQQHYVRVLFDEFPRAVPVHPQSLIYESEVSQ